MKSGTQHSLDKLCPFPDPVCALEALIACSDFWMISWSDMVVVIESG